MPTVMRSATTTLFSNPMALMIVGAVLAAVVPPASTRAAGSFDGAWKVTIITQAGNCDPAYSYPVKVEGGRVS